MVTTPSIRVRVDITPVGAVLATVASGLASDTLHGAAVDGDLQLPAWVVLALRESFFQSDDMVAADGRDPLRAAVARMFPFTDADLDALAACLAAASLPGRTSLRLEVSAAGMPGRSGYRFVTRWLTSAGQVLLRQPKIHSIIIESGGTEASATLTAAQARVLALVASLRSDLGRDFAHDRRAVAQLQGAVDATVSLAGGLGSIKVVEADTVRPRLRRDGHGWRLQVDVPGQEMEGKLAVPMRIADVGEGAAIVTTPGHATATLLSSGAKRAVSRSIELGRRRWTTADVAKVVSRPAAYLGHGFDLSEFSDRVVGIGPPVARPSVVVRETEPDAWWSEGLVLQLDVVVGGGGGAGRGLDEEGETSEESGPTRAPIRLDAVRAAALQAQIDAADVAGETWIAIDDALVPLSAPLRMAVRQAMELEATRGADGRLPRPARQVLQIHDNIETITYARGAAARTPPTNLSERPPHLGLEFDLKPHQREGVAWLRHACDSKVPGVLLADDMGLGKTLQVLAFLDHLAGQARPGPFLVIAPSGLLDNWRQEATRYFGDRFQPMLVGPDTRDFQGDIADVRARLAAFPLTLVSYESARRYQTTLGRIRFRVVVADEAHRAKNPSTQTWFALSGLQADFRVAMTGTPVENGLQELWAIVEATHPALLGSLRTFGNEFIKPLREASVEVRRRHAESLHERLAGVFLRRKKREVLGADLPDKRLEPRTVPLSSEQLSRYREVAAEAAAGALALPSLLALLMTSAHPALRPHGREALPPLRDVPFAKGLELLRILDAARGTGEKVLIFAGWHALQAWIAAEVREHFGFAPAILNGEIDDSAQRVRLIDRFSADPGFAVLVLSARSAGVGLNITSASQVIHYTREWNPAVEDQATDRAWRMGQRRTVVVHTIATAFPDGVDGTTVEQRLAVLLERKRALADTFIVPMGALSVTAEELAGG